MKISEAFEKYWEKNIRDPDELLSYLAEGRIGRLNKELDEKQITLLFSGPVPRHESRELSLDTVPLEKGLEQAIAEKIEALAKSAGIFSNPAGVLSESISFLDFLKENLSAVTISMYHVGSCATAADHFYNHKMFSESSKIRKAIIDVCSAKKREYEQKGKNDYQIQKLDKILAHSYSYLAESYHSLAKKNVGLSDLSTKLLELTHNALSSAIELYEGFGPDTISKADKCVRLGFLYWHIGHIQRNLRRFNDAKQSFKIAISVFEQVPSPGDHVTKQLEKARDSLRRMEDYKGGKN